MRIDVDSDGLGTMCLPPPDTQISFCTSSLYPGCIGGTKIHIRCRSLCGDLLRWNLSHLIAMRASTTWLRFKWKASWTVTAWESCRRFLESLGTGTGNGDFKIGGFLQMKMCRFSRKTAFDLPRQDRFLERIFRGTHVINVCITIINQPPNHHRFR